MKKILLLLQTLTFAAFANASVAFAQCGGPGATPGQIYHAFGDSITAGFGASMISNRYVNLIGTDKALVLTDLGVSGSQACDVADAQIIPNENPGITNVAVYTEMLGLNDADIKGTGAYEANYNNRPTAGLSWLGIPSIYKKFAQTGSTSGQWSNDLNHKRFDAYAYAGYNGSSDISLVSDEGFRWWNLYLRHRRWRDNNNKDGADHDQDGGVTGRGVVRITGVPAASHIISVNVTSATSPSNSVSIGGIGTPGPSSDKNISYGL
jgi:hypothetical protein